MTTWHEPPAALRPFYNPSYERSIVLNEGRMRVTEGDAVSECDGQIHFSWRPSPKVRFRITGGDLSPFHLIGRDGELDVEPAVPALPKASTAAAWSDELPEGVTWSGELPPKLIGDGGALQHLLIHVVNLDDWWLPERIGDGAHTWPGRLSMTVGDWSVRLDRLDGAHDDLRATGGHAITHVLDIRRTDGATFRVDETDELRSALWHVLSFANGALIGLALPVGFDPDERACWGEWSICVVDPWRHRLTWFEAQMAKDLEQLVNAWMKRAEDEFWDSALNLALRMALSGNDPSPLDVAIVTTQTALELLAWSVLVIGHGWVDAQTFNSTGFSAAAKIRLLLRWAGVEDTALPPELTALTSLAAARNLADAPETLVWIRNRVAHPPMKHRGGPPEWPLPEQLQQAWRLGLEYVELVLLRLLDHGGNYGRRIHLEGRWPADIVPVPWADVAPGASTPTS